MKAKILYTNGQRIVELFWITHTGTDLYCGMSGSNIKRSYHASGKLHMKQNDEEKNSAWIAPLNEVKGQFHLMTIAIANSRKWPKEAFKRLEFTGRKVDTVLYVDARSIPDKENFNITIGLLEPFKFDVLSGLMKAIKNVKQVLLATDTIPWVYCILIWPIDI